MAGRCSDGSNPKENSTRKEAAKEKSWTTARGKRELQEIVIETYENQDHSSTVRFIYT